MEKLINNGLPKDFNIEARHGVSAIEIFAVVLKENSGVIMDAND